MKMGKLEDRIQADSGASAPSVRSTIDGHTPLPWHTQESINPGIWYVDSGTDDHGQLATVWGVDNRAEGNAKLIVHSVNSLPALLKALEEILSANDEFRKGMPDDWEGDPMQDACEQAREILSSYRNPAS